MSDLTSLREFFQDTETDLASALSEPLYQKFGGMINFIIDSLSDSYKLGDLMWSCLSQAQLDSIVPSVWVKPSGQSIVGTDYQIEYGRTTAPDCRGLFIRGLDNGRGIDGGRVINTYQASQVKSHTHALVASSTSTSGTWNPNTTQFISSLNTFNKPLLGTNGGAPLRFSGFQGIADGRPVNMALQIYVKVNN